MVGNSTRVQSSDPFIGMLAEDINDPRFAHYRYKRSRAVEADPGGDEPVPLFLFNKPEEYDSDNHQRTLFTPSRILTGIFAASIVAMGLALFSVEAARDVFINAKASVTSAATVQAQASVADAVQPVAHNVPLTSPERPSRDEIAAAYQAAIKSQIVVRETPPAATDAAPPAATVAAPPAATVAAPPAATVATPPAAPAAAPPARRLDPDELAALLKRARGLLAIGDIAPARLLLERAADAQEADAALLLARTYDPEVLGTPNARSITPDPAAARIWYRKAAELGSQHAQQRLAQMQD